MSRRLVEGMAEVYRSAHGDQEGMSAPYKRGTGFRKSSYLRGEEADHALLGKAVSLPVESTLCGSSDR
ncbi:MAG: hypothetical protein ACXVCM_16415 [Ktedonobacteraceae bacterium]